MLYVLSILSSFLFAFYHFSALSPHCWIGCPLLTWGMGEWSKDSHVTQVHVFHSSDHSDWLRNGYLTQDPMGTLPGTCDWTLRIKEMVLFCWCLFTLGAAQERSHLHPKKRWTEKVSSRHIWSTWIQLCLKAPLLPLNFSVLWPIHSLFLCKPVCNVENPA